MTRLTQKERGELLETATKMLEALKNDPVQGLDAPPYLDNGVFTAPGVFPDMFSTVQKPVTGFADALPVMRSEYKNVEYAILTSQTESEGTNPADVCGTAPVPGVLKECKQISRFGELYFSTEKIKVTEIGKLNDIAVNPRTIMNYAGSNSPWVPEPLRDARTLGGNVFRDERFHQYYKLGTAIARAVAPVAVDGNYSLSNSATEIGFIKEPDGIARLIKTGHVDAETSDACAAADSTVIDWGTANIDATATINGRALNITETLNEVAMAKDYLGERLGLNVMHALVMDYRLFTELAHAFAYQWAHQRYGSSTNTTETTNRERSAIEARFEQYIQSRSLPLMGRQFPVLFTSGRETRENDFNGGSVGDIYYVAMIANGAPVTYWDYFDLSNSYISAWDGDMNTTRRRPMNNGMFLTAVRSDGFCDEMLLTSQMRMIHRTPFMSAKILNIGFNQPVDYRDPFPGTTYFYGGGTTKNTPALS